MGDFDLSLREDADRFHAARASGGLQLRLVEQAFGEEYPAQVEPSSSCTWSVLAEMVRRLRLAPGELLVDLGCGRGGTGLWLARALATRLIGVDLSPVGVKLAAARATDFLPEGRARFQVGTFESTGLPDACADGVVSMDALPFAPDREAALRELARILRPGARAVFTVGERLPGHPRYDPAEPGWAERAARAGLLVEAELERPEEAALWLRLYELWEQHEAELRVEIGDEATEQVLIEARQARPVMRHHRSLLLTVRASAPARGPASVQAP
ncbi:class I SAM-dependent methyltransferase [Streptacidiphilus carbonis]|uniref:class I SAM-dependent methyltransferase n=1 Tax=Streptacidiphilus carbonis TaxID=105422 RepID=UPI0005A9768D|nr:class I SAM-dependent methyltransferase [Streptacidiphilus carbonis]